MFPRKNELDERSPGGHAQILFDSPSEKRQIPKKASFFNAFPSFYELPSRMAGVFGGAQGGPNEWRGAAFALN